MFERLRSSKGSQLDIGLLIGVAFGFLLQRGGATRYDVILGQLLLRDFTVVKIMLSAVIVGMLGVHLLRSLGLVEMHVKAGSLGSSAVGGVIFGVGFAVLGYCPGTVAGAVGNGYLDALVGGVPGMLLGAGVFAACYPRLDRTILQRGGFRALTLPELFKVKPWVVVVPAAAVLAGLLAWVQSAGL